MNKIKLTCKRIIGMLIVFALAFGVYQPCQTQAMQTVPINYAIRYIRDYINGNTANQWNHWVELQAFSDGVNVALNKPSSTDGGTNYADCKALTDGNTDSGNYVNASCGLQYIQTDLGNKYNLSSVIIWHYYADGRTYHNTKTQVSTDGINWITLFDSAVDGEYVESSSGHTVKVLSLNLATVASPSTNSINLSWTNSDNSQPYSYMLYSKNSSESAFQSIPAKSSVHVLNVYPESTTSAWPVTGTITFKSAYYGTTFTLPTSASAKMWMEQANAENPMGYGKGLVTVDTASLASYNNNVDSWMKYSDGRYKYDAVYFGAWDGNSGEDISSYAESVIEDYLNKGYGVLLGHDTAIAASGYLHVNFCTLAEKYLNMYTDKSGYTGAYADNSGGTQIKIGQKGLLTNYPWPIGNVGTVLTVPNSHVEDQFAMGDVWLSYIGQTAITSYNGKAGTDNFYLSTWNNIAMIQTGHSNGQATPDEQKILANTLFYLAQITTNTSWQDHKGQDLAAPNVPTVLSVTHTADRSLYTVNYSATDAGTSYQYYVEATGQNDGAKYASPTVSTAITTGVKGYSIVVDNNPNTVPNGTITTTAGNYTFARPSGSVFYIHIAAVDGAGNVSSVTHKKVDETVSVTHPINANYSINPNSSTPFLATDLPITNNSDVPVKVSIQSLSASSGGPAKFTDVLPSKYADWNKLTAAQTKSDIALGIQIKETVPGVTSWSAINQSGTLYAAEITGKQLLGTLNPNGAKGNLTLSAKYGLAWDKNTTAQHQLSFVFDSN